MSYEQALQNDSNEWLKDLSENPDEQYMELVRDAKRYRYLRKYYRPGNPVNGDVWVYVYRHTQGLPPSVVYAGGGDDLDSVVDAAMRRSEEMQK